MQKNLIGITGNPGTGKKSVSTLLSRKLDYDLIHLNSFARQHDSMVSEDADERIVEGARLARELRSYLANRERGVVVSGHLLPSVLAAVDMEIVIVLRCSPERLLEIYLDRGYTNKKINENLITEAIGVIASEVLNFFNPPRVAEIDTTKTKPEEVVHIINSLIAGETKETVGLIDWLPIMIQNEYLRKLLH